MKKSGILAAASMAAASATAISSSPSSSTPSTYSKSQSSREEAVSSKHSGNYVASADKFAPRFDGLRFIETLVTAHR
ncbi:uncharacterized protein LOC114285795 [Camellia sinensis]|uniref:uncharacterized protein LOC114285795 n=1 Tax=Camellia sinensis TaxID=4442 RepID=UPI001036D4FA|nr:uncharacterized protein LOC114285795 [Camellia sinensis]